MNKHTKLTAKQKRIKIIPEISISVHNSEIAAIFNRVADLLEIKGENPFRVRAYRNAARMVGSLSKNVSELMKEGIDLTTFPGIGNDLAHKILVITKTGKLPLLTQIEKKFPAVLTELLKIEGLGPKRVLLLYKKLAIKNIEDLQKAIAEGKVRKLKGLGEKTEKKILACLHDVKTYSQRIKLIDATFIVDNIMRYLKKLPQIKSIECAGSFRRKKETVGDLDFVVSADKNNPVLEHFIAYNEIIEILSKGNTRSSVRLKSGLKVDLRVVNPKSYGAVLLYFTGSKAHNIALRKMALQRKLKINEYGVFKGKKAIAGMSEKEIYHLLNLPYIPPEMREDRGEIELAKQNKLPNLIERKDIKGDLHCHTNFSDGIASIEDIVIEAQKLGYQYIAMTDHTKNLSVANGLDKAKLQKQFKLIDRLNNKFNDIVILKSAEVDILENGKLDLTDDLLKELDFTVCSIHSKFNLSQEKQTERIMRAMDKRYFNILGHPTGRLINEREAYHIDIERIMQAAKDRGCILEINAQPERLDLNDVHCKMAKELSLKLVISSDAHSIQQLHYLRFGIYQARRGWLEANDIINTYNLDQLRAILKR